MTSPTSENERRAREEQWLLNGKDHDEEGSGGAHAILWMLIIVCVGMALATVVWKGLIPWV